jgi:hypothetical protein
MEKLDQMFEQFKVHGKDLVDKVQELIHEGNVRRIIVKDEHGNTFMEIPMTVAAMGAVVAPILAALGAIATVVGKFDVAVERTRTGTAASAGAGAARAGGSGPQKTSGVTDNSVGAKEEQMDMAGTVAEHSDNMGTKLEDLAGTGQHDSMGG